MTPERNCTNCCHFRRDPSATNEEHDSGECRRHPPTVLVDEEGPMTIWPVVTSEGDCGEWRACQ